MSSFLSRLLAKMMFGSADFHHSTRHSVAHPLSRTASFPAGAPSARKGAISIGVPRRQAVSEAVAPPSAIPFAAPLLPNRVLGVLLLAVCLQVLSPTVNAATLSNNLDKLNDYTELIFGSNWITASFGTGARASVLGTVTLLMQTDTPGAAFSLNLFSANERGPSMFLGQLSSPSSYTSSLSQTSFGGAGLALAANSTYWLVAEAPAGQFEWGYTASNEGTGIGFQHTWGYSEDAGGTWFTSDLEPMQMKVENSAANPVPEPASFPLLLLAILLVGLFSSSKPLVNLKRAR